MWACTGIWLWAWRSILLSGPEEEGEEEIHGFDLSEKAIGCARRLALSCGLNERAFFQQMNAQDLKYSDEMFSLPFGKGVLHHISK